jgi:glucokinase
MIGLSVEHPETEAAIRRITGSRAERITAEQVFRLANEGDKVAQRIVNDVHTYLAIALANIVHLINPGVIILGGQVAQVGELLSAPVRIVHGTLGSEANSVGAVMLALQDI